MNIQSIKKIIDKNQDKIPKNFDWKSYVHRYEDLRNYGIDNEVMAKFHYITFGHKENREYHKINNIDNIPIKEIIPYDFYITDKKHLAVSILLYYPSEASIKFLNHFPELIIKACIHLKINQVTFIIRNNSFNYNSHIIISTLKKLEKQYKKYILLDIKYINSEYNMGYGEGHNNNFNLVDNSDWFLIMNDDMGFPDTNWLLLAIKKLEENNDLAIVGSSDSPGLLSDFANGYKKNIRKLPEPEYIEGSIFLIKSDIYKQLKGFDPNIKYFYFEDVDLCLRTKQINKKIETIHIPHQHFRASSSSKVTQSLRTSIIEYNRAYFFSKWNKYIVNRQIKSKILIDLSTDGIGDMVDCFYPVQEAIKRYDHSNIDFIVPEKAKCLYNYFQKKILFIDKSDIDFSENNYDTILTIKDLNFSPPLHSLDLISAKFGIDNFNTDESNIKKYLEQLPWDTNIDYPKEYAVIHLDSQRTTFEGRTPKSDVIISILKNITKKYNTILIGQSNNCDKEIQQTISTLQNKSLLIDNRDSSITDIFKIINKAIFFVGLDSGPSHIAQLLNIPSYIIYGPINPATKIYRYDNSGCYYNLNIDIIKSGYHLFLEPAYHSDIRGDDKFIDCDPEQISDEILSFIDSGYKFNWLPIFEALRAVQREFLITQMHNPMFKNKLLTKQNISVKTMADSVVEIMNAYENYANKLN